MPNYSDIEINFSPPLPEGFVHHFGGFNLEQYIYSKVNKKLYDVSGGKVAFYIKPEILEDLPELIDIGEYKRVYRKFIKFGLNPRKTLAEGEYIERILNKWIEEDYPGKQEPDVMVLPKAFRKDKFTLPIWIGEVYSEDRKERKLNAMYEKAVLYELIGIAEYFIFSADNNKYTVKLVTAYAYDKNKEEYITIKSKKDGSRYSKQLGFSIPGRWKF